MYIYVRLLTAHKYLFIIYFIHFAALTKSVVVRCLYFLHPVVYNVNSSWPRTQLILKLNTVLVLVYQLIVLILLHHHQAVQNIHIL
jgi:hypothetical protein